MARPRKQPKSLHVLIRDAFSTPLGKAALDELVRVYVLGQAFHKDPYQNAFLSGQRYLVQTLDRYTNSQPLENELVNTDHDPNRDSDGSISDI